MNTEAFWSGFEKQAGGVREALSKLMKGKGLGRISPEIAEEMGRQGVREGLGFFASPALGIAGKLKGKKKVVRLIKAVQKPALHADVELGYHADKLMQKLPFGKNLFKHEDHLRAGKNTYKKALRPSITAPLSKTVEVAKPIVFGLAVGKGVEKLKEKRKERKALEQHMKSLNNG
jgi:hypothetical protein